MQRSRTCSGYLFTPGIKRRMAVMGVALLVLGMLGLSGHPSGDFEKIAGMISG